MKMTFLLSMLVSIVLIATIPTAAHAQTFENPLDGQTVFTIIGNVVTFLLSLATAFSFIAIIVSGVMLMTSLGNEQKMARAKLVLFWAIAGIAVVMLAWVVLATVGQIIGIGTFGV